MEPQLTEQVDFDTFCKCDFRAEMCIRDRGAVDDRFPVPVADGRAADAQAGLAANALVLVLSLIHISTWAAP